MRILPIKKPRNETNIAYRSVHAGAVRHVELWQESAGRNYPAASHGEPAL